MRGILPRWPLVWAASTILFCLPAQAAPKLRGQVNLNTATEAELRLLPGIGPVTAKKIIEARQEKPFRRIMELVRVPGIGMKRFRALEPHLAVEGPTTLERMSPPGKKKKNKKNGGSTTRRRYRVLRPQPGPKIIDFRSRNPVHASAVEEGNPTLGRRPGP